MAWRQIVVKMQIKCICLFILKRQDLQLKCSFCLLRLAQKNNFYTFFFGNENATTEIPISGYSVLENGISISQYTEDGSGPTKDFSLDRFPNLALSSQIPTKYIKEQTFLLGTDKYGRDLLSRMLIGIRISLAIGFVAVFISLTNRCFYGCYCRLFWRQSRCHYNVDY